CDMRYCRADCSRLALQTQALIRAIMAFARKLGGVWGEPNLIPNASSLNRNRPLLSDGDYTLRWITSVLPTLEAAGDRAFSAIESSAPAAANCADSNATVNTRANFNDWADVRSLTN